MRKHLLLFALLLLGLILPKTSSAQKCDRTYSGVMRDQDEGSPMPGVNVVIKGKNIGTVTDINGKYLLKVCLGDVVVFSFVGYDNIEVVITETNSQSEGNSKTKNKIIKRYNNERSEKDLPTMYKAHKSDLKYNLNDFIKDTTTIKRSLKKGEAQFTKNSPTYRINNGTFIKTETGKGVHNIKNVKIKGKSYYVIEEAGYISSDRIVQFDWQSNIQFDQIGKLPELQNTFVQGRSINGQLEWQGAENNEVFSWGPAIYTQEYNGQPTPYQTEGNLVYAPNGTGAAAHIFDASKAFQTGITTKNVIQLSTTPFHNLRLNPLNFRYQNITKRNIYFPTTHFDQHNLSAKLKTAF